MTDGSPFPVAVAAVAGAIELPYAATGDAQGPAAVFLRQPMRVAAVAAAFVTQPEW